MNSDSIDVLKNFTVLCVEDEAGVRDELTQFLTRRVKQLYLASNGAEGLAMFKAHSPDMVITDILMPVMDGLDMSKAIRSLNPDVPIIITTAFNDPDLFVRAIEFGVSKYVLKPINIRKFIESVNEVAWLLQAHRKLRLSAAVFNATAEAIMVTDATNTILSVNAAFTLITGYSSDDVISKNPKILSSGNQNSSFYKRMWETLNTELKWEGEIWNRHKNGTIYPEWLTINKVVDEHNALIYYVAIFSDLTVRKEAEDELYRLAHYDLLTNLPNRKLLLDRLQQTMGYASRSKSQIAVLFIDLDRFKYVNDTFGHLVGDLLLQDVSRRLTSCVRSTDTVCRLGGDEFVILLPQVTQSSDAAHVAKTVLEQLTLLFVLQEHEIYIGGSIGIAMYPMDGDNCEALIQSADAAMYAVKAAGRNDFRFFNPNMNDSAKQTEAMRKTLFNALKENQFELLYQFLHDNEQQISGVKTVLQWNQPTGNTALPADFLRLAEKTGFLFQLEKWMLRTALTQIKALRGDSSLKVIVNIFEKHAQHSDFSIYVSDLLDELQLDAHCLELEIHDYDQK